MLTDRDLRLARRAASKLLPAKLEDFVPAKPSKERKPLVVGVYKHANRWRANIKQPDGSWRQKSFATPEEAVKARTESIQ